MTRAGFRSLAKQLAMGAGLVTVACNVPLPFEPEGRMGEAWSGPEDVAQESTAAPSGPCADGTPEQTFSNGMVGCAGRVTWDQRASLCGSGYVPATAADWNTRSNGTAPTHDYWTDDHLRYSGDATACAVSATAGTSCGPNTPMRVCTAAASDPEGNACNWRNCGYGTISPNRYYGGCVGNVTAGTLCIAKGCADGSIEQTFSGGMVGCAGKAAWANRAFLCAQGYRLATAAEWVHLRGTTAPTHHYWTQDNLKYIGTESACAVSTTTGTSCRTGQSMHVCKAAGADPEGNTCSWAHCGFNSLPPPDQYFGGCAGNLTAGALCIPDSGCADGTNEQVFADNLVGCAGKVTWDQRSTLCASGWTASTASQWVNRPGIAIPTHNYWTADNLRYVGTAYACIASPTTGTDCGANSPMRVCTPLGSDTEGNACNWQNCGYLTATPNQYFGGCVGNTTAGTLCSR
ncbi:hypothetical protein KRR26_14055 [Corallococcus sp. M34]|uniref:hypothetical protein n=1 Tax=Citreicoccus inhibens TaxID=2849499 RepID=UPI001C22407F|nr:hypothetical protein [Citreicoccus inhibens]MBU8896738.1 hypothetical protein [Citreicoccus inhibens]